MLNIHSNTHRIYLPRQLGGRGLLSVTDQYKKCIINMSVYLDNTEERLLKLVKNWTNNRKNTSIMKKAQIYCAEKMINYNDIKTTTKENRKQILRKVFIDAHYNNYNNMPLHGQLQRELNEAYIDTPSSLNWIQKANLKPTTEATIFAIQEQAVTTNVIKKRIHNNSNNDQCRLCKSASETIHHIISGCPSLAKSEYIKRHNNVAKEVYIRIGEQLDLIKKNENKWYNYEPAAVIENEFFKLLWDFPIQTDKTISNNKPDIIILDKASKTSNIIDIAIPSDYNIVEKRNEKITKYIDLSLEIKKMWNVDKVTISPVIIGATGILYKGMKQEMTLIPGKINVGLLQKIAILGTAYIWRKFNELIRH